MSLSYHLVLSPNPGATIIPERSLVSSLTLSKFIFSAWIVFILILQLFTTPEWIIASIIDLYESWSSTYLPTSPILISYFGFYSLFKNYSNSPFLLLADKFNSLRTTLFKPSFNIKIGTSYIESASIDWITASFFTLQKELIFLLCYQKFGVRFYKPKYRTNPLSIKALTEC